MIIHRAKVTIPKGRKLILIPLGDIQGEEQIGRLDRLVDWCVAQKKKGHIVKLFLTGDYFETFSPSERVKKAGANFHETTLETIHSGIKAQADDFARRLSRLRGDILILLQGHHWENVKVGGMLMSSDQYIAERLDAEYAGDGIAVIDLLVNGFPFRIMAMHGYGTGRMAGGRLNKRFQMREVVLNCHWFVMGHDNEKMVAPKEPLLVENGEVKYLKQYFTGVGCFQESYHIGKLESGYAEKVAYSPASIGVVIGTVQVDERKKRLDYHIST